MVTREQTERVGGRLTDRVAVFLATLGYVGYCPKAPGTVATALVGVPVVVLLARLPWGAYLAAAVAASVASWLTAGRACSSMKRADSPRVVIDELAGFLVATVALPVNWRTVGLCFILFRFFDIAKPWPVCLADKKVPGGLWVTLDDVLAGLYTLALAHVALALWPAALR